MGKKIKCKNCGKTFEKKTYQQKFCCPRCKQKYWDRVRPDRHKDPLYYEKYNEEHGRYYEEDDWDTYSWSYKKAERYCGCLIAEYPTWQEAVNSPEFNFVDN